MQSQVNTAKSSQHCRFKTIVAVFVDLYLFFESSIKETALKQIEMLEAVVNFKQKFYPSNWASYHRALPKTLKLIPEDHVLKTLEKDYKKMHSMIFGIYPKFEYILKIIQSLENEINNM